LLLLLFLEITNKIERIQTIDFPQVNRASSVGCMYIRDVNITYRVEIITKQ
jgi:hypothetical protein